MNSNQKTIIFISLILLLGCGIFLPYDGVQTYTAKNEKSNLFIGYFPFFNPPSKRDIIKPIIKSNDETLSVDYFINNPYYSYESHINLTILIIQFFILVILTIGLVVLFADSKHKGKPATNKEG